jgi:HSP20 family protein
MAEVVTKMPARNEPKPSAQGAMRPWQPFESFRREVDRLFDEFDGGFFRMPFRRRLFDYAPFSRFEAKALAVDVVEKENEYQITAELPGVEEKDIEVKLAGGGLLIRGEKKEEKEEKEKDYHLSERRYGSFERYFAIPEGVDQDKIAATFTKGVLSVTLPKTMQAQKEEKKIAIKAE